MLQFASFSFFFRLHVNGVPSAQLASLYRALLVAWQVRECGFIAQFNFDSQSHSITCGMLIILATRQHSLKSSTRCPFNAEWVQRRTGSQSFHEGKRLKREFTASLPSIVTATAIIYSLNTLKAVNYATCEFWLNIQAFSGSNFGIFDALPTVSHVLCHPASHTHTSTPVWNCQHERLIHIESIKHDFLTHVAESIFFVVMA